MERRDIRFDQFQAVRDDLKQLHDQGYSKTGNWDLAQTAEHLADWATFPIDGFPKQSLVMQLLIGLLRITRGKSIAKAFIRDQRMPPNSPTIPSTVHAPSVDPEQSFNRLLQAIDRLEEHQGPLHPSPLFGTLTKEEVINLQLAHHAHHLSFLVPTT